MCASHKPPRCREKGVPRVRKAEGMCVNVCCDARRWCRTAIHRQAADRFVASCGRSHRSLAQCSRKSGGRVCSAGRTGRIGLLVMGRLRSLGCVMLIEISASREDGARSLCVRVTHCTARGERQRDYATSTVDSQRRGAKREGRHA